MFGNYLIVNFGYGGTAIGDILILANETECMTNKNIFCVYVDDVEPDNFWIHSVYPNGKVCFLPWISKIY